MFHGGEREREKRRSLTAGRREGQVDVEMWRCGDRGGIKGERGRKEFWLLNLNKITDVIWQVTIVTRKTVLYPQIFSCYIPEYILHCVTLPQKKSLC